MKRGMESPTPEVASADVPKVSTANMPAPEVATATARATTRGIARHGAGEKHHEHREHHERLTLHG